MHKKIAIKKNSFLFLLVHFFEREIFDQKKLNVFFSNCKTFSQKCYFIYAIKNTNRHNVPNLNKEDEGD
jgi:hypothetical protein